MAEDLYDEDIDQPIAAPDNENSGDEKEDGDYGEEFLAPKSAFASKGELGVGDVHKVRIESIQENEVVIRCIKSESESEPELEPEMTEEPDTLYE